MVKIEWQEMPPRKGQEGEESRLFPRMKDNGVLEFDTLCELAAKGSGLSEGTLYAAWFKLARTIAEELAKGKTVKLDDLGSLRLSIGTDAKVTCTTKQRKNKVKVQGVTFQPDGDLMKAIGKPDFEWQPDAALQHAPSAQELAEPLCTYLDEHGSITRAEFARVFRLKRTTAINRLHELACMDVIRQKGYNREAVYVKRSLAE